MSSYLLTLPLRLLLDPGPRLVFTPEEEEAFERLFMEAAGRGGVVRYAGPYPKWRFIAYAARTKPVLLHGSNQAGIRLFEPRSQALHNGKTVEAVLASRDGIWPVFQAVLDRSKLAGGMRNACLRVWGSPERFYLFSGSRGTAEPWTRGTVYFLPAATFRKAGRGIFAFDEWISTEAAAPIASIEVGPEDFIFNRRLAEHQAGEPMWVSWLLYKWRNRRAGDEWEDSKAFKKDL